MTAGFQSRDRLGRLIGAALALPGVTCSQDAAAEIPEGQSEVRLGYYYYQDWQQGSEDRMRVKTSLAWFRTAPLEDWEVEGNLVLDSMSGASPLYLNSLTGVSGIGVDDQRRAGDLKVTRSFSWGSLGVGGAYSGEDDYVSRSGLLEARILTEDKNRTLAFGISPNFDSIYSTNNPSLDEERDTWNLFFGITQVINPNSIFQGNLALSTADGYLFDQYKLADLRPRSRDAWSLVLRHNHFFPTTEGALHSDYRYFNDSWGIDSHTFSFQWYQPLGSSWMVRPGIRLYSQSEAQFFNAEFPPLEAERFYSTDQRVGEFGSLSVGLKVEYALSPAAGLNLGYEWFKQRPEWALTGSGAAIIEDFSGHFFGGNLRFSF